MNRIGKQFVFGLAFLIFLAAILAGVYFLFFNAPPGCFDNKQNQDETGIDCGGGCAVSCEVKNAQPLEIVSIFAPRFSKNAAVVTEIKNPNAGAGAIFSYSLKLASTEGVRPREIYGDSFIYPGEVKRIVEVLEGGQPAAGKEMIFSGVNWKPAGEFKKPDIQLLSQKTEMKNAAAEMISGILARNLASGDQGEDVKLLQRFLSYNNFYAGEISGRFGSETKKSLTAYQKARRITPAAGALDSKTRQTVNAEISSLKDFLPPLADAFPVSVSGVVQNNGVLKISKVVINAFIYARGGGLAGVSKTELEELAVGETREFRVSFSPDVSVDEINATATKIEVYAI